MSDYEADARAALQAYALPSPRLTPVDVGLINVTFRVDTQDGLRFALQRLSPIFGAEIHEDIEAVTRHLAQKGLETPRLVPTRDGALYTKVGEDVWRILTWLDGDNVSRAETPERTRAAGIMLGRFHAAVQDLQHEFRNTRLGVHDTKKHLAGLSEALSAHRDHRLYAAIEPIGRAVLEQAEALGTLPDMPDRVVHGDPKLNNIVFDPATGAGRALIDLDTLAKMPIVLELGDAFRSWCNPAGEDARPAHFDLDRFAAAFAGYAQGAPGLLTEAERASVVPATATIILELAARFAADALNESYFGWDRRRFATRGEHNALRAEVQLSLARSMLANRGAAEAIVDRAPSG